MYLKIVFVFLSAFYICACYPHHSDVGRVKKDSYEDKKRTQEELIARQAEIIKRQEREIKNIERQKHYDNQLDRFDLQEY